MSLKYLTQARLSNAYAHYTIIYTLIHEQTCMFLSGPSVSHIHVVTISAWAGLFYDGIHKYVMLLV